MRNTPVCMIEPTKGSVRLFRSIRALSRQLSGNGSDNLRTTISNRLKEGGGYVKGVWVSPVKIVNNTVEVL